MTVPLIDLIQRIISLSLVPICLGIGTVGNILNFLVFVARLKNSGGALYFVVLSLADMGSIWVGFFPRFLSPLLGYDPIQTSSAACKIRQYLVSLTLVLLRHFLCVISIHQLLIVSWEDGHRRMNSIKMVRGITISSVLFWAVVICHSPIFYDVREGIGCSPQIGSYTIFVAIYNLMVPVVVPVSVIGVCSYITLKRTHQVISRVNASRSQSTCTIIEIRHRQRVRQEIQMTRLILIQGLVYIVLNLPNTIYTFYFLATMNDSSKSSARLSIESFLSWLFQLLLAVYCTVTIFLYIRTSASFKRQCLDLLRLVFVRHQPSH